MEIATLNVNAQKVIDHVGAAPPNGVLSVRTKDGVSFARGHNPLCRRVAVPQWVKDCFKPRQQDYGAIASQDTLPIDGGPPQGSTEISGHDFNTFTIGCHGGLDAVDTSDEYGEAGNRRVRWCLVIQLAHGNGRSHGELILNLFDAERVDDAV